MLWLAVAFGSIPLIGILLALPGLHRRWTCARTLLRAVAFATGIGMGLEGSLDWKSSQGVVFVSNHASFCDALAFVAYFPEPVHFVAASEFAGMPIIGGVLRRIGVMFVHRDEPQLAVGDMRHIIDELRKGNRLFLFPEGSLDPQPGIRPFLPGAFFTATRAEALVVPIGLSGTRGVLAPRTRLPRSGFVTCRIGEAVPAGGIRRSELASFTARVRDRVVDLADEPDLEKPSRTT